MTAISNASNYADWLFKAFKEAFQIMQKTKDFNSKWHVYSLKVLKHFNYRTILKNEVVFDFDDSDKEINLKNAQATLEKLEKAGFYASLWGTGGKGYHVHVWFNQSLTRTFKELFLKKYGVGTFDLTTAYPIRMIGLEFACHRNTGKQKTKLDGYNSAVNSVDLELLYQANEIKEAKQKRPVIESISFKPSKCKVIDYCLNNRVSYGGLNICLTPNCVALGLSDDLLQRLADLQGFPFNQVQGWQKKNPEFNCKQMQEFAKEKKLDGLCEGCHTPNIHYDLKLLEAIK